MTCRNALNIFLQCALVASRCVTPTTRVSFFATFLEKLLLDTCPSLANERFLVPQTLFRVPRVIKTERKKE